MCKKEIINYWLSTAENDYKTMLNMYKSKNYNWALFIGHLVIEKILKAYYVKKINKEIPFTHDLLRIAQKTNLNLSDEQKDFLDTLTTFNIRVRYDDYKLEFYNKCNKKFTQEYITKIKGFKKWIKDKL